MTCGCVCDTSRRLSVSDQLCGGDIGQEAGPQQHCILPHVSACAGRGGHSPGSLATVENPFSLNAILRGESFSSRCQRTWPSPSSIPVNTATAPPPLWLPPPRAWPHETHQSLSYRATCEVGITRDMARPFSLRVPREM